MPDEYLGRVLLVLGPCTLKRQTVRENGAQSYGSSSYRSKIAGLPEQGENGGSAFFIV